MRRQLIIFANGHRAVLEGLTLSTGSPVAEAIDLDGVDEALFTALRDDPKGFTPERNEDGAIIRFTRGKQKIPLSPAPVTPPTKRPALASNIQRGRGANRGGEGPERGA